MPNDDLANDRARARASRVSRAISTLALGIRYRLGHGGYEPNDPTPTRTGFADCTGWLSWALGIDRYQADKAKPWSKRVPWVESTLLVREATRTDLEPGAKRLVRRIPGPVPGEVLAWPDRKVLGVRREGHAMLVYDVDGDRVTVLDCTSKLGPARRVVSLASVTAKGGCAMEVSL